MFANAKGLNWNQETTKSLRVPVILANSCPIRSPNRAARQIRRVTGETQIAARTVPLTAQAHQKEARLRSSTASSDPGITFGSTNMRGDPKTNPTAATTKVGSNTA